MAITVLTDRYRAVHGKDPKGRGGWSFVLEASHGREEDVLHVTGDQTYRDACAVARKRVRSMGYQDATLHAAP